VNKRPLRATSKNTFSSGWFRVLCLRILQDGEVKLNMTSRAPAQHELTGRLSWGWVAVMRIWPCGHRQLSRHERREELRSAPSDSSTGLSTTEFNDGSMSGQLGDDRSERISGVGADNEVGEAAVLPPPQDLLGGRRRVAREYQERVRRA
jgi:hypothetical protein